MTPATLDGNDDRASHAHARGPRRPSRRCCWYAPHVGREVGPFRRQSWAIVPLSTLYAADWDAETDCPSASGCI